MNTTSTSVAVPQPSTGRHRFGRQRGAALFIALIALIALTLAGLALVRSVDTSNLIAGNFAFRQAALHANDVGVENAVTYLLALRNGCATNREAMNQNLPANCTAGACRYYASMRDEARGMPSGSEIGTSPRVAIDWNATNLAATQVGNGFSVQYVIDRMCQTNNPGDEVLVNCFTGPRPQGNSNSADNPTSSKYAACDDQIETFYRVTVRVTGPRNTLSMVQTIIGAR
jgi:type IV pilus assembly protein PilX